MYALQFTVLYYYTCAVEGELGLYGDWEVQGPLPRWHFVFVYLILLAISVPVHLFVENPARNWLTDKLVTSQTQ